MIAIIIVIDFYIESYIQSPPVKWLDMSFLDVKRPPKKRKPEQLSFDFMKEI